MQGPWGKYWIMKGDKSACMVSAEAQCNQFRGVGCLSGKFKTLEMEMCLKQLQWGTKDRWYLQKR